MRIFGEVSMSSKQYTAEFHAEAIWQVTEREYPVREVTGFLGVSTYSLYKWLKGVNKTPRLAAKEDLRAENARMKAELRRVEEERDILKKAAAYFAKASG
jgi:transposase